MELKRLNTLCDEWSDFSNEYLVGDDGFLYRLKNGELHRLKSGYCRSKEHSYQQVRQMFGTNRKHTIRIHRAVALAFVPRPFGTTDVDHVNNIKTDNRAINLQWLTNRANVCKIYTDRMVMA